MEIYLLDNETNHNRPEIVPTYKPRDPAKRELTDKQELFLKALFSEDANGDVRAAMNIAGYSKGTPTTEVVGRLKNEIIEEVRNFLASNGPIASMALVEILLNPTKSGNDFKLKAAKEILDRIGAVPPSNEDPLDKKITIQNVIVLPEKKKQASVVEDVEYETVETK